MENSSQEHSAIVNLLTRIYTELVEIEDRFALLVGVGDTRPRIDYFHDAIRAFTSGDANHKRLNVEMLSYDLRCLRYIQEMPIAPFKKGGESSSPSGSLIVTEPKITTTSNRPDRETKSRIVELYKSYAVMFAALLKPYSDKDYQERTDSLDNDAKDLHQLIHEFEGKCNLSNISALIEQLEEHELRIILTHFLHQQKHKNKDDVKKLISHLKNQIKSKDNAIKSLDKEHMNFALAQLGIFEESKDMLKKLAQQGMNLVGKFVENSIADTKRQMGR